MYAIYLMVNRSPKNTLIYVKVVLYHLFSSMVLLRILGQITPLKFYRNDHKIEK